MDPHTPADSSAEVQAALMGALLSSRGVPEGLQDLDRPGATAASPGADEVDVAGNQISSDTAALVGIFPDRSGSPFPGARSISAGNKQPDEVTNPQDQTPDIDDPDPAGVGRAILEWAVVLVGAVVMALLLRQFLFQAFYIPSESMETTLETRDRVLVNRLSYQWGDVGRGDVVVFARKPEDPGDIRDLIKRVIGLPGETVEGRDNTIYIDGIRLDEPYIDDENRVFGDFGPVVVPEHELFVMGDNRDQSFDSRFFGTVDLDRVAGRAFVLYWPIDRVGSL